MKISNSICDWRLLPGNSDEIDNASKRTSLNCCCNRSISRSFCIQVYRLPIKKNANTTSNTIMRVCLKIKSSFSTPPPSIYQNERRFSFFLVFLCCPFSSISISPYTFSAILNLALRERGFRSTSSSVGTITLLLTKRKGDRTFPKKSCSHFPSKFPVFKKFFTRRSSKE